MTEICGFSDMSRLS